MTLHERWAEIGSGTNTMRGYWLFSGMIKYAQVWTSQWTRGDRDSCARCTYHKQGSDDPVHNDAKADLLPDFAVREDLVERLIAHFAQDRVHHDEQADGYRNGYVDELSLLQGRTVVRDKIAENDANGHGEEDPESQEPV